MAASGRPAPPKPWERAGAQANSGPSPFVPSTTTNSTAAAIASSGAAADNKPTDQAGTVRTVPITDGTDGRVMPLRPWERNNPGYGTNYGSTLTGYNRPYNSYGGYNSYPYGNTGYGNSAYGGGMYGGGYTSNYGYGGGMYNRPGGYGGYGGGYGMPLGGPMGGYGGYGPGNPMNPNPDDPYGGPPRPPNFWQSMLTMLQGVMGFFGRLAILIDENTQAFHFFISALLQLCDRAGVLYGELARFVLRLLGFRPRSPKARSLAGNRALAVAGPAKLDAAPAKNDAEGASWDKVWSKDDAQ